MESVPLTCRTLSTSLPSGLGLPALLRYEVTFLYIFNSLAHSKFAKDDNILSTMPATKLYTAIGHLCRQILHSDPFQLDDGSPRIPGDPVESLVYVVQDIGVHYSAVSLWARSTAS